MSPEENSRITGYVHRCACLRCVHSVCKNVARCSTAARADAISGYRKAVAKNTHHGRIIDEMYASILQRSDTAQRHTRSVLVQSLAPAARIAHGLPHLQPLVWCVQSVKLGFEDPSTRSLGGRSSAQPADAVKSRKICRMRSS